MSKINPLDLPEIRLSIAQHLKKRDLARCLRVCWSWHDTFLPFVWERVSVCKSSSGVKQSPSQDPIPPKTLHSHRHLIKNLRIVDWPGYYPFAFPRLQTLSFHFNGKTLSPANYPAPFIKRNQSLVKLHLWKLNIDIKERVWKVLQKLPHLRELSLGMFGIDEDDIVRFWTICENLERLILKFVSFPPGSTPHASMSFRNIRELQLHYMIRMKEEEQFRFISACPNLEDLTWNPSGIEHLELDHGLEVDEALGSPFEEFAKEVARKRWPRLTSFRREGQWTEEDTCLIIEGMQRVKKIDLDDNMFTPLVFQALQRHFKHLVELQIETSNEVASKQLQIILCSCPALKTLLGGSVLAKDVVEGKPWVCLSLETLGICIMFNDTEQHLQPLIFEGLAKLTRLERLYSWTTEAPFQEKYPVPLQFCLESGLDALSDLRRMVSFITNCRKSLGEDGLRWMLVHWKELVSVSAEVDIDDIMKIELQNLFKSHGIKRIKLNSNGNMQRLTSLTLDAQWTEEDTCLIIEGMQRVVKIDLFDTFGPLTFQALQRHFNNLVELEVETSSEAASKLLQNIMCSCPALKMLKGGSVLSGLDALSGLWRMVSFTAGFDEYLGEDELRWMLVHWKELTCVSTKLDVDDITKIELENLFKSRGIDLRTKHMLPASIRDYLTDYR
ncbi:hypothetical protein EDD21DRAFT_441113 [Dissophora ornata]|nr:hypothetical protein BGZ58_002432 [Dissophora ornata]KAI8604490.1 hypothetical protein EDD21DRAFT_441113 [Dissophora ornata]